MLCNDLIYSTPSIRRGSSSEACGWEQDKDREVRAATAALLGRLMGQPLHGPRVALVLQKLFPPSLVSILQVQAPPQPSGALSSQRQIMAWELNRAAGRP